MSDLVYSKNSVFLFNMYILPEVDVNQHQEGVNPRRKKWFFDLCEPHIVETLSVNESLMSFIRILNKRGSKRELWGTPEINAISCDR